MRSPIATIVVLFIATFIPSALACSLPAGDYDELYAQYPECIEITPDCRCADGTPIDKYMHLYKPYPVYTLDIDGQKFNMTYILKKPYTLDRVWLDKEDKTLFIEISSKQVVTENKTLTITIPPKLIRNIVYQPHSVEYPLDVTIDGKSAEYEQVSSSEEESIYVVIIPPNSSLSIQMKGTQVIPEFPLILMALVLSFTGLIFTSRFVSRF